MFEYSRLSAERVVKNQKQILYALLGGFTFVILLVTMICIVGKSEPPTQTVAGKLISNDSLPEKEHLQLKIISEDPDPTTRERREKIREMALNAWENYKKYAWGRDELHPISKTGDNKKGDLGATIVDSLDTLYVMNLTEQYKEGRDWVAENFTFKNKYGDLSVFETNIRFMGSFLTMYAFTEDPMYKSKAKEVADILSPAFDTNTGIPKSLVNIQTGESKTHGWTNDNSILSEIGALHLEFAYMSDITGEPVYRDQVMKSRNFLKNIPKLNGLYPTFINPETGKWGSQNVALGAFGDTMYEYLLKMWIQSNKTDTDARDMYNDAIDAVADNLIRTSRRGLKYITEMRYGSTVHVMDHLACFAGGLFALSSVTQKNKNSEKFMQLGKDITNTCHESYIKTTTHLGPERFRFNDNYEAQAAPHDDKRYLLRPEVFESYFVLWRLTHDQKYRDWAWDAVESIEKYCKTPTGYGGIENVNSQNPQKNDVQESFFIAEVLKYLYLLYSDDSVLPLDQWVFNTEAHPLPIKGNPMYRQAISINN